MPLYEITGPDGGTFQVEGPEGATQAQLQGAVQALLDEEEIERKKATYLEALQREPEERKPDDTGGFFDIITPDFLEEALKGTLAGTANIAESGLLGAATVLDEGAELAVREGIQSLFDPIDEALSVDSDTGAFARGARKFGEGLGSFGGILAASAVNPVLGASLAISAGAGEASERARAGGATEEQRGTASLLGAGVGLSELISPMRILRAFKKGVGDDTATDILSTTKRIVREGGIEAGQEFLAGVGQNLIEQKIYNPEQGTFEGAGEQAIIGGGVGGFVQGMLELVNRSRIKTNADGSQEVLLLEDKRDADPTEDEQFLLTGPPDVTVDPEGTARTRADVAEQERLAGDFTRTPLTTSELEALDRTDQTTTAPTAPTAPETTVAADPVTQTTTPPAEADATTKLLDDLGVLPKAAVRKRLAGKDLSSPDAQAELEKYANNTQVKKKYPEVAKKINDYLASDPTRRAAAEEQIIAQADAPAAAAVAPEAAPVEEAASERVTTPEMDSITAKALSDVEEFGPNSRNAQSSEDGIRQNIGDDAANEYRRIFDEESKKKTEEFIAARDAAAAVAPKEAAPNLKITPPEQFSDDAIKASQATGDPITLGGQDVTPAAASETTIAPEPNKSDTAFVKANSLKNNPLKSEELPKSPDDTPVYFATLKNEKGAKRTGSTTPPKKGGLLEVRYVGPREGAVLGLEAVYDIVNAETGDPQSTELTAEKVIEYTEQDAIGGYFSKSKDKNDPNLKRWRNIDDEDVYTNRVYEDADPFRPLEFIEDVKKEAAPAAAPETTTTPEGITTPNLETADKPFTADFTRFDPTRLATQPLQPTRTKAGEEKVVISDTVKKGEKRAAEAKAKPAKTVARSKVSKETSAAIASKVKDTTGNNPLSKPTPQDPNDYGGKPVQITASDGEKILKLFNKAGGKNSDTRGAYDYFSKHQDPSRALLHIAHDLNHELKQQNTGAPAEPMVDEAGKPIIDPETGKQKKLPAVKGPEYVRQHFEGTGLQKGNRAFAWIKNNLDKSTFEDLQRQIDFIAADIAMRVDDVQKYGTGKEAVDRKTAEEQAAQERVKENAKNNRTSVILPKAKPVKTFTPKEIQKYIKQNKPEAPQPIKKQKTTRETEKQALRAGEQDVTEADTDTEAFQAAGFDIFMAKQRDRQSLELKADAVVGLDIPLHPSVRGVALQGDLSGTLEALGLAGSTRRIRQLAGKLANITGDTKLVIRKFVNDDAGNAVAGKFDPKTNTITLNAETGINAHTILHEMTHAATSATLSNKSHPLTKQLTKLFNDVKDSLDTEYGASNVDEFVAEAFGNPVFQRKLAGINPKGEPISALQRFFNSVANVLRRLMGMKTKPVDSALDATDNLINNMLAPAPEHRDAGALAMMSTRDGVQKLMDTTGKVHKSLGPLTNSTREGFVRNVAEYMSVASEKGRLLLNKLFGSQSLGDVAFAAGLGNIGARLHKTILEQRGAIQIANGKTKKVVDEVAAWANKNPEQKARLDRIIYHPEYGATIYQVDPERLQSDYKGKKDDYKNDLEAVWKQQHEEWKRLDDQGKEMFRKMRNYYKKQYEELKKVIEGEIDIALAPDPDDSSEAKARKEAGILRLKNDVFAMMFGKDNLPVYFPLLRTGRYKLTYTLKNAKRDPYVVRMFEYKKDRDKAMRELENDDNVIVGKDGKKFNTSDGEMEAKNFIDAPSTSFVGETLAVLRGNQVDPEVQDQIMRLFIDTLPETSFAKSLQGRKGLTGHLDDSLRALKTKGYDIGRQTQRMKYGSILRQLEKEIDEVKPKDVDRKSIIGKAEQALIANVKDIKNELKIRANFARKGALDKNMERYYKTANQGAFIYTIGFNASSAMVNLSQIPIFAYPYMAAEHGAQKAWNATMFAMKTVTSSKLSIDEFYDVTEDKDGKNIYTVKKDLKLPADRIKQLERAATLVRVASERGAILGRSYIEEALGLEESKRERSGGVLSNTLDQVSGVSAIAFQAAEKFNRQTILLAQYDLIMDKMTDSTRFYSNTEGKFINTKAMPRAAREELAANEAMYQTEQTNGGMVLETAPRISQEGILRVAMMYKTFGLNLYYTMFRTTKRWLDSEVDPEIRKTAFKQMVGVHGSAALFAGIHGVPLYGIISNMYDLFFAEDDEEDFDTIVRTYMGEGFFKGVISAYGGVDVSERIKLNDLVLQENRFNTDPSAEEFIGQMLGGPALSTGNRFLRGISDLREGEIERGIESLMPPGIANAYKATFGRYQRDGGIYTRRGDPIYDDITGGELFFQAFGFAPTNYTREQEKNQITKKIDRAVNDKRTKLLKKYYVAMRMGDFTEAFQIRKEMLKFSQRHISAAIYPDNIDRSMRQHAKTSTKMHNGITISPLMENELKWMRASFD